jgi:hypothetical protein
LDSALEVFDGSMKKFEEIQRNYFNDSKLSKQEVTAEVLRSAFFA